jgi:hypothetical protein
LLDVDYEMPGLEVAVGLCWAVGLARAAVRRFAVVDPGTAAQVTFQDAAAALTGFRMSSAVRVEAAEGSRAKVTVPEILECWGFVALNEDEVVGLTGLAVAEAA